MKTILLAFIAVAMNLSAFAGGQFVITNGSASMVLSPVIDQKALPSVSNRVAGASYSAGEICKISNIPYIARFAGDASPDPASSIQPKPVITDGGVTWIRCRIGIRMGFSVQWVSGGDATLYVNGGPVLLSATNIQAISIGPEYRGPVYVLATGADTVLNVADW
jgi:hypothetical protein